jgi:hypothetical protein
MSNLKIDRERVFTSCKPCHQSIPKPEQHHSNNHLRISINVGIYDAVSEGPHHV